MSKYDIEPTAIAIQFPDQEDKKNLQKKYKNYYDTLKYYYD